jgi:hypothetical protein
MKTNIHSQFFLEGEIFQTKVEEKIKTHILVSVTFEKNRAVYQMMWKNNVEPDRPKMTRIRRMRFACWITETTDTHSECVIFIAFPLQQ